LSQTVNHDFQTRLEEIPVNDKKKQSMQLCSMQRPLVGVQCIRSFVP
jgi:hypothetical protein